MPKKNQKHLVSQMRPKTFRVLELAVEDGTRLGWQHAHKHTETPGEQDIIASIQSAVLNNIDEWFVFDDEES